MKRPSYGERDYTFGQRMLSLRTDIGLTQTGLAGQLGVSRRAVSEWEAGSSYPKALHLKHFLELCMQQRIFPVGREEEEIRALWKATHQKVLLDEAWLSTLLNRQPPSTTLLPLEKRVGAPISSAPLPPTSAIDLGQVSQSGQNPLSLEPLASRASSGNAPREDWGDALDVPSFYGREGELATLTRWIVQERCRVVSVLGMGGIGKSALATLAMRHLASSFQVVFFRSLRNAPSYEVLLDECLQVLAPQLLEIGAADPERRLSLLLSELQRQRVLLLLDNLEALLLEGDVRGHLRPGYEGYSLLLQAVAQRAHQSCLLLTSREKPAELRALEGRYTAVRSLRLSGLEPAACQQLLATHDLLGDPQERTRLVERYGGNPLALNIVAETIFDLFGGEVAPFLAQQTLVFGGIAELLSEQWTRLSPLEQTLLYWLAIVREPVTIEELRTLLVSALSPVQVLEALDSLHRRSLVERGQRQGSFTLQSVVLEYVTTQLIAEAASEIEQGKLSCLLNHGLELATARDYVRQTQQRLLVAPLLTQVRSVYHRQAEVKEKLLELLDQLRTREEGAQGYGPANVLVLLREQRGHLRDLDLSQLVIRGLSLQGVEMQDSTLCGALIQDSIFTGSLNTPWTVAISRSGEYWAVGSLQGKVHVWRKGIQSLHLAWQAHTNTVIALTISPDGGRMATGSWDSTLKLWDLDSGVLFWTGWHTNSINSAAFSPDGSLLASSGNDTSVRLWDSRSGTNMQTLPHPHPVYAVAWSPDGHLLASGDFNGAIRLWEMQQTPAVTRAEMLSAHSNWVTGLAFSPDGHTLVSASWDRTVRLWEVPGGRLLQTLEGHTDQVNRVAWSPDGRTLASCSYDKTIWLWDVEHSRYRARLLGHTAAVYSIAFSPDGTSLLSGSEDGTLRLWDVASGQCLQVMQGYAVSFYDIAWSPDGTHLVSGGTDALVTVWDVTGETLPRVLHGHDWNVFGVAWSPDGRFLASSGWDRVIRLWDPISGACVQILRDPNDPNTLFEGVAWSPDGRRLSCGTDKNDVHIWEVPGGRLLQTLEGHTDQVDHVAWSPDGTRLASSSDDGSVCIWDAADGRLLQRLRGHQGKKVNVAWSPEGSRLATCGGGAGRGELDVWDAQSGEHIRTFGEHPSLVYSVAWSLNGALLVSGGSDGVLCWWEVESGKCVRKQTVHQATIKSLRTSPDGRFLASCSVDGTIMLWNLQSGEPVRTLRRDRPYERLNITGIRGLTQAQKATLRALGAVENEASTSPEQPTWL